MIRKVSKNIIRKRKHDRVRKKITGTAERPRLCVYRSLSNIYAQIIDDSRGETLISASTLDKEIKEKLAFGGNIGGAAEVGTLVAQRAIAKGIETVVFDRGGYLYHGRVAALAAAARDAGLKF
jgi:large subunit ribosomal protein L18